MKYAVVILFFSVYCFSQDLPNISATGNQLYCGEAPMPIVTSISIVGQNGAQGTLQEIFVQISAGYTIGDDLLILTGTHPNISVTWATGQGLLTLTGPATYVEFENAIADIRYLTSEANFTEDKSFSINLGNASFLPTTGHYYRYVSDIGITWTEAKAAAESENFFGL